MRMLDVEGVEMMATRCTMFEFLRDSANLPRWADAFDARCCRKLVSVRRQAAVV